jgi:hypothetical protein
MVRAWAGSRGSEPLAPRLRATLALSHCAILFAAKREYASRCAASAMVWGNWDLAAAWEEQRVTSEHALARLQLERCFGPESEDDC